VACLELFPNSFKQVVAAKQTGQKRDQCTHSVELCLYHLEQVHGANLMSQNKCKKLSLRLLASLHTSREKLRLSYHDTLLRSITNLVLFLDVAKPRAFDADDLLKELPQEQLIGFAFQGIEEKAAELGKVLIKDCAGIAFDQTLRSLTNLSELIK